MTVWWPTWGWSPGPHLQALQRAVLTDDADFMTTGTGKGAPTAPLADRVVPAQLPADVAGFTGRAAQLARLDALLTAPGDPPPALVISTIGGAADVTWLSTWKARTGPARGPSPHVSAYRLTSTPASLKVGA